MEIQNKHFIIYSNRLPSYKEFYKNVMQKNIACLFNSTLTDNWICRKEWIHDDNRSINFDTLVNRYGEFSVTVYNCNEKYFNSNSKKEMKFIEYVEYWKNVIKNQHRYDESSPILYLKDWHLVQDSKDISFYDIPIYFESDFLNEYCTDKQITDYKFTYMGPKSSSTPLHIDVFGSFSWSANVFGTKKWLMIPKNHVSMLKKLVGGTLPHNFYSLPDQQKILKQVEGFEIIQKTGEILFVPSGYMHQVTNLEDTISINHNWFNACNIDSIYSNLLEAFEDVKNELNDLKDLDDEWNETCQRIMTIHFGMNLDYFLQIIRHMASRLLDTKCLSPYEFKDIKSIVHTFSKIFINNDFSKIILKNDWQIVEQLKNTMNERNINV